jgi:hypothetical protein
MLRPLSSFLPYPNTLWATWLAAWIMHCASMMITALPAKCRCQPSSVCLGLMLREVDRASMLSTHLGQLPLKCLRHAGCSTPTLLHCGHVLHPCGLVIVLCPCTSPKVCEDVVLTVLLNLSRTDDTQGTIDWAWRNPSISGPVYQGCGWDLWLWLPTLQTK